LTKEILASHGVPVAETYGVVASMGEVRRIERIIGDREHFVIKPARGRAGFGIAVLGPKQDGGWKGPSPENLWQERDIRRRLGDILSGDYARRTRDRALIEERLFPGSILGNLQVIGLPDIRIITLDGNPMMGMVRLPTKQSGGKANLHLGAIGVGIDLETGRSTSASSRNGCLTHHPESHERLAGLPVASWDLVMETTRAVARALPLRYLGIDIAIAQDQKPVVLEVNVRPGLEIQNVNQRGLRIEVDRILTGPAAGDNGVVA